jgi:ferredoxin
MPLIVFEAAGVGVGAGAGAGAGVGVGVGVGVGAGVSAGVTVEVDAPEGGRLVDFCDERNAPVPFSCRSASCGTCRVDVLEGGDRLAPPRDEELDVLDIFGDSPGRTRLACQAFALPGPGRIRVRPAAT